MRCEGILHGRPSTLGRLGHLPRVAGGEARSCCDARVKEACLRACEQRRGAEHGAAVVQRIQVHDVGALHHHGSESLSRS